MAEDALKALGKFIESRSGGSVNWSKVTYEYLFKKLRSEIDNLENEIEANVYDRDVPTKPIQEILSAIKNKFKVEHIPVKEK